MHLRRYSMTAQDTLRAKLENQMKKSPEIHVTVSLSHPRVVLEKEPAVIKGVYAHIFQIEEYSTGAPVCRTLQYNDILSGHITVEEIK